MYYLLVVAPLSIKLKGWYNNGFSVRPCTKKVSSWLLLVPIRYVPSASPWQNISCNLETVNYLIHIKKNHFFKFTMYWLFITKAFLSTLCYRWPCSMVELKKNNLIFYTWTDLTWWFIQSNWTPNGLQSLCNRTKGGVFVLLSPNWLFMLL